MTQTTFRLVNVPPREEIEAAHRKIVAMHAALKLTGETDRLQVIEERCRAIGEKNGWDFFAAYKAATGYDHPVAGDWTTHTATIVPRGDAVLAFA